MPFRKLLFATVFISIATIIAIAGCLYFAIQKPALAAGNIINATSCEQADVQAAVNQAVDGDTIIVPAGSCAWTTPIACSGSSCASIYINKKAITLRGAGTDKTIIIDNTGSSIWSHMLIWAESLEGKDFRITGLSFQNLNYPSAILIRGTAKNWRIDHNKFSSDAFITHINADGFTYGLTDHNDFRNGRVLVSGDDDAAWKRPLSLGSDKAIYIEDNNFNCAVNICNAVDANGGGRYVFRYNNLKNLHIEAHSGCPSGRRATFSYEIYKNNINTDKSIYAPFSLRGGTGVVFDNSVSGIYTYSSPSIHIDDQRSCNDGVSLTCNARWDKCDGTSSYDGNTSGMSGYPCRDQIGRSTDSGVTTVQAHEPLYEWNNIYAGAINMDIIINPVMCATSFDHIQEGRDFYNNTTRPNYTPYAYPHPLIAATSRKGDFNLDDKVNNLDLTSFKNAFKSLFNSIFDLNSDSTIDVRDLGVLMNSWLP